MTYKDLQAFIDGQATDFIKRINNIGAIAFRSVRPILNDLELNKTSNNVSPTPHNLQLVNEFGFKLIEKITSKTVLLHLNRYVGNFAKINKTIIEYYANKFGEPSPMSLQKIKSITSVNDKLARDTMGVQALNEHIFTPAVNAFISNLQNEVTVDFLINDLGFRIDARFDNYLRPRANSILQKHFREVSTALGNDYKLVWVTYTKTSSSKSDSRDFCKFHISTKSGNPAFYHVDEVTKNWPQFDGGDWDGMIEGTNSSNILTNGGGYGCVHSFRYARASEVSAKDKLRAKKLGFI